MVAAGIDPSAKRLATKTARSNSFEAMAREFFEIQRAALSPTTFAKRLKRFEDHLFPYIGSKPITGIAAPDLLMALKRVEGRGNHETAHRLRSESGQIFRYAIATGRAERDISADLRGVLAPVVVSNHAAITDLARIGELLRAIDGCSYGPVSSGLPSGRIFDSTAPIPSTGFRRRV